MTPWLAVSWHTPDDLYRSRVAALRESLEAFGIPHEICERPTLGSWLACCEYKPRFILEQMERHPDVNIAWLDADAVVKQRPVLFDDFQGDLGLHIIRRSDDPHGPECYAGTLFFRNAPVVREFVGCWVGRLGLPSLKPRGYSDQTALEDALALHGERLGIRVVELPPQYCLVEKSMDRLGPPVILQTQASRVARLKENA